MKYIKKVKIAPNFKIEFEILSQGHRKKIGPKIKKIYIYFAECHGEHSVKMSLPSAGPRRHSAKFVFKK